MQKNVELRYAVFWSSWNKIAAFSAFHVGRKVQMWSSVDSILGGFNEYYMYRFAAYRQWRIVIRRYGLAEGKFEGIVDSSARPDLGIRSSHCRQ